MEITEKLISDVAYDLYAKAVTGDGGRPDIVEAFKKAYEKETHPISKAQFKVLIDSIELSKKTRGVRCQDTGTPQFWVTIGSHSGVKADIRKALTDATAKASVDLPLRGGNVNNPLTGEVSESSTGPGIPAIWWDYQPDADYVEIMAAPRGGGGSLGWAGATPRDFTALKSAEERLEKIKEIIIKAFLEGTYFMGCGPNIVGICIGGGSREQAAAVAWKLVFRRPVGSHNPDLKIAKLEDDLLKLYNEYGRGNTRGLSLGDTQVLGVHAEALYCRGVNLAVSIHCNFVADARARIHADGKVEYL